MKIEIHDRAAMESLRSLEVATYLRSKGWIQQAPLTNVSNWDLTVGADLFEVVVPLDESIRDYALRMGDVLRTLAVVENRSEGQIYSELLTIFADVVRIRIDDPDARDGTLTIEGHAQIAQKARDLFLAAACSTIEHRDVWHSKKPARAIEHVRKLRVGQSERGSYIVTVISSVSPTFEVVSQGQPFETEPPFERRVIQTLATSLATLDTAAAAAALSGKFDSFDQSIEKGVSANLCDAVAGLWGDDGGQRILEIMFSWSPARPVLTTQPSSVRFAGDKISIIREASRVMKERAPVLDFELEGAVVKLDREPGANIGKVTVLGIVDGKPKRVILELEESHYHKAVQAHAQERALSTVGCLVREGRGYRLQQPRDVFVEVE
jgi:hypothetical protein